MWVSYVRPIILDKIGVDSIFLGPDVPEIFYFKHDIGTALSIIFIGKPDILML